MQEKGWVVEPLERASMIPKTDPYVPEPSCRGIRSVSMTRGDIEETNDEETTVKSYNIVSHSSIPRRTEGRREEREETNEITMSMFNPINPLNLRLLSPLTPAQFIWNHIHASIMRTRKAPIDAPINPMSESNTGIPLFALLRQLSAALGERGVMKGDQNGVMSN